MADFQPHVTLVIAMPKPQVGGARNLQLCDPTPHSGRGDSEEEEEEEEDEILITEV